MTKKQIIFFLLLACLNAKSQSYHFSQFYSTPLLNNPAFTGYTDGTYRVAANFRSQWVQGDNPYITNTLSADFSPFKDRIKEGSKAGIGFIFTNDQSLGGALQVNTIGLSLAYNLPLDIDHMHTIGLGLQGSLQQRKIDLARLSFENQFGSNGYDAGLPIGEIIDNTNKKYVDMNAGIKYNYSQDYKSYFFSVAAFNVLQHKDNALPEEFKMPTRYSILGGGQVDIGYDGTLYFSINHLSQARANETTLGSAYGLQIGTGQKQEIDLGMWYRVGDALIPYIGYQLNNIQAGLSYDYTISKIKTGSVVRNGFELSFIFTQKDNSELKKFVPWY